MERLRDVVLAYRRRRRSKGDLHALRLTDPDLANVDLRVLEGFGPPDNSPRPVFPEAPIRIVLHLHYPDLWLEFQRLLQEQPGPFGLIATLTPASAHLTHDIQEAFPGAIVRVLPNRGRDIGPFFEILAGGLLDGATLVCKIHGKRSVARSRITEVGERWRRSALLALLGHGRLAAVTGQFDLDSSIGLAGPEHLLLPNDRFPSTHPWAWGNVREEVGALAARLGLQEPKLCLFAGSMLWLRAEVLERLKALELSQDAFPDEAAYTEFTLAHACERIFAPAAESVRLRVVGLPLPGPQPDGPREPDSSRRA